MLPISNVSYIFTDTGMLRLVILWGVILEVNKSYCVER